MQIVPQATQKGRPALNTALGWKAALKQTASQWKLAIQSPSLSAGFDPGEKCAAGSQVTMRRVISYMSSTPMLRLSMVRNSLLPWNPAASSALSRQGMKP